MSHSHDGPAVSSSSVQTARKISRPVSVSPFRPPILHTRKSFRNPFLPLNIFLMFLAGVFNPTSVTQLNSNSYNNDSEPTPSSPCNPSSVAKFETPSSALPPHSSTPSIIFSTLFSTVFSTLFVLNKVLNPKRRKKRSEHDQISRQPARTVNFAGSFMISSDVIFLPVCLCTRTSFSFDLGTFPLALPVP